MSVTVLIKGRNGVIRWQPSKSWLLLPGIVLLFVIGLIQFGVSKFASQEKQFEDVRLASVKQQQQVRGLKLATESQLATLAAHVARMQANMTRLEALGQQVAKTYKLEDQFDFAAQTGIGGLSELGQTIELEQLIKEMDVLVQQMDNSSLRLPLLESVATNIKIDKEKYVSGRPILRGWLSSHYGLRNDPFTGRRAMHKGIDFAGAEGDDVIATAAGVVTWAGSRFGYGNLVEIDHGNGLRTRYGHNKTVSVAVGDVVTKGEAIAVMGSTGRSTGAHVHYEVLRDGQPIDPSKFVYRKAIN